LLLIDCHLISWDVPDERPAAWAAEGLPTGPTRSFPTAKPRRDDGDCQRPNIEKRGTKATPDIEAGHAICRSAYSLVATWFGVTFIFGTYSDAATGVSSMRRIVVPSSSRQLEHGP
jgi:hypothetical protein